VLTWHGVGTGDAHISISQKLPLSGAVVVSTPQEMALVDARRGVDLYRQARGRGACKRTHTL
jgi:ATP-binding protein involved in chromosome partitioning